MLKSLFVSALSVVGLASAKQVYSETDLDTYVWTPDENYGWTEFEDREVLTGHNLLNTKSWKGYTLNMTSQKWLTEEDFSPDSDAKPLWWHYLIVIVPDDVKFERNASLWVTGGSVTSGFPDARDEDVFLAATLAMETSSIMGCLFQIPNEHTTFSSDPIQKSRNEDAIIAFTWDHYLKDPSQPEWLLRFPMVKATLRAMDAMTEFVNKKFPEESWQLDYYTVAGASKRGWTTWDVGAVDPERVVAIVPIVLDAINFVDVEHHQWRSYGGWSWALVDYYEMNLMERFDSPNMVKLQEQVDPFFYKERLTMPKLVVNAVLDEFQQPDDTHYWWDQMPSPKHFIMTPNAEHSEATGILEIVPAIGAWISYQLHAWTVPVFTWDISEETGKITATLDGEGEVHEAAMWYAYSCGNNPDGIKRRDFRIMHMDVPCECGIGAEGYCINLKSFWTKVVLEPETNAEGQRVYTAQMEAPDDGRYVAFMIDIKYNEHKKRDLEGLPHDLPGRLEFTTEVSVWPNTFPYEDCSGVDCKGTLL
jgi:PhoPQ-activated pathogenicity-related protein